MKKVVLFLVFAFTLSSCTQRLFDFTILSSKNVDLSKFPNFVRGNDRVNGKDIVHVIITIPAGIPNLKEAVDKAIEKTPGCIALLDGVIKERGFYIPVLYGQFGYIVEGTPLIDPSIGGQKISEYSKIELNKKGEVIKISEISKDDYLKYKNSFKK